MNALETLSKETRGGNATKSTMKGDIEKKKGKTEKDHEKKHEETKEGQDNGDDKRQATQLSDKPWKDGEVINADDLLQNLVEGEKLEAKIAAVSKEAVPALKDTTKEIKDVGTVALLIKEDEETCDIPGAHRRFFEFKGAGVQLRWVVPLTDELPGVKAQFIEKKVKKPILEEAKVLRLTAVKAAMTQDEWLETKKDFGAALQRLHPEMKGADARLYDLKSTSVEVKNDTDEYVGFVRIANNIADKTYASSGKGRIAVDGQQERAGERGPEAVRRQRPGLLQECMGRSKGEEQTPCIQKRRRELLGHTRRRARVSGVTLGGVWGPGRKGTADVRDLHREPGLGQDRGRLRAASPEARVVVCGAPVRKGREIRLQRGRGHRHQKMGAQGVELEGERRRAREVVQRAGREAHDRHREDGHRPDRRQRRKIRTREIRQTSRRSRGQ